MEIFLAAIVLPVTANIIARIIWRYICKWLDRKESNGGQPDQ